ncbi:hypothetical protein CH75_05970 [Dyella jiangningensis]|nr:hypothetical protein CH75_05970 [Dyella jiangningensis]
MGRRSARLSPQGVKLRRAWKVSPAKVHDSPASPCRHSLVAQPLSTRKAYARPWIGIASGGRHVIPLRVVVRTASFWVGLHREAWERQQGHDCGEVFLHLSPKGLRLNLAASRYSHHQVKSPVHFALPKLGHGQDAAFEVLDHPFALQGNAQQTGADGSGKMRPPFAPVQAVAGKAAPLRTSGGDIHPQL